MRLSGWQRIGLIASVVYGVGMFAYEYGKRSDVALNHAQFMNGVCQKLNEQALAKGEPQKDCGNAWSDAYALYGKTNVEDALIIALTPIPFFWLFTWIARGLYRWVRKGFQSAPTQP